MKLYWGSGSAVSWRAQLALALKGLAYDSHRLDLGNREHRGEAFRAINPRGTFPVLVDGDVTVRDSLAIIAYLDRRHPEPPLFGTTPERAAVVWQHVAEHDSTIGERANRITQALFRTSAPANLEPVKEAVDGVRTDLQGLEALAGEGDWLADAVPSAAEVVYYPTVHRLLRASAKPQAAEIGLELEPLGAFYPALARWLERVAALPGVDGTYPPHWREG